MRRFDPNNDDGRDTAGLLKQRTYEIKSLADIILHNASGTPYIMGTLKNPIFFSLLKNR
jgi:hypothetical protein